MSIIQLWPFLFTGIFAGIASGLFGIGGGLIIVPILIFIFKYDQHAASGTSLVALLLPVGILAALNYYQAGKINGQHIRAGLMMAVGLTLGAYVGSKFAIGISPTLLRKIFAGFLLLAAIRLATM